jgi:hypothetical protein
LDELDEAENLGLSTKAEEARRKVKFTFDKILAKLNDIEFFIG